MKIELEHSDICKALAYYLRTKNFAVDADPRNFIFKEESDGELLVVVKNGDMVTSLAPATTHPPPVQTPAPRPAPPSAKAPAPLPAPARPQQKARIFAKNDPFEPVPPPREQVPAPRMKILDPQAARSPALMTHPSHPGMPAPREIVQNYGSEKRGEEMVEDGESAALSPSGLIVDPSAMSDEDQKLFQDILARSASQIEEGPTTPDVIPSTASELDMMGAGELLE
jgi:hypothetical protein